jgi:cytochrome c biogenesis protein CcmG/thiol:disulfide interchange protein DsbE
MKRALVIVAGVAVVLAWILLRPPSADHKVGTDLRPAPDFTLTDLSGNKVSLSNYRGKVVLLDFWATWCAPCKEEIPHFVDMQNRYGPRGLQVIGISMDDDEKPVRAFQQQFKMNYPVAVGTTSLAEQYGGVLGLPITFVIDPDGRIVSRHIGQTSAEVFEGEVQKLLAK